MTVAELIIYLGRCAPDARVVIPGYRSGQSDIKDVNEDKLWLNANLHNWEGPHEFFSEFHDPELFLNPLQLVPCVSLTRE